MNDRHPSGTVTPPAPAPEAASAHYASYGEQGVQYGDFTTYDGYAATGFDANASGMYGATGSYDTTGAYATTTFDTDPLFGDLPGNGGGGPTAAARARVRTTPRQWATGSHQTLNYDPYAAQHHAALETGSYDTSAVWRPPVPAARRDPGAGRDPDGTGQWDANAWLQAERGRPHPAVDRRRPSRPARTTRRRGTRTAATRHQTQVQPTRRHYQAQARARTRTTSRRTSDVRAGPVRGTGHRGRRVHRLRRRRRTTREYRWPRRTPTTEPAALDDVEEEATPSPPPPRRGRPRHARPAVPRPVPAAAPRRSVPPC